MVIDEINEINSIEDVLGSKARMKIIKALVLNGELNISKIISKTHLNHTIVLKRLDFLKSCDLIQEKIFGRIKIYRYKIENAKARSLKKFIGIWENSF